jgi:propionyl-CoA carboxylase alpha chain
MDIPIYYDPMLSKLIVHAADRGTAIAKMIEAIRRYEIVGVETTLDFCRFVLQHEAFVSGQFDTGFVGQYYRPELLAEPPTAAEAAVAASAAPALLAAHDAGNPWPVPALAEEGDHHYSAWRSRRT